MPGKVIRDLSQTASGFAAKIEKENGCQHIPPEKYRPG